MPRTIRIIKVEADTVRTYKGCVLCRAPMVHGRCSDAFCVNSLSARDLAYVAKAVR